MHIPWYPSPRIVIAWQEWTGRHRVSGTKDALHIHSGERRDEQHPQGKRRVGGMCVQNVLCGMRRYVRYTLGVGFLSWTSTKVDVCIDTYTQATLPLIIGCEEEKCFPPSSLRPGNWRKRPPSRSWVVKFLYLHTSYMCTQSQMYVSRASFSFRLRREIGWWSANHSPTQKIGNPEDWGAAL